MNTKKPDWEYVRFRGKNQTAVYSIRKVFFLNGKRYYTVTNYSGGECDVLAARMQRAYP